MPNVYYDPPYLDEAEHAATDHTGIPGVGGGGFSPTFFSATHNGGVTDGELFWDLDYTGPDVIVNADDRIEFVNDGWYSVQASMAVLLGVTEGSGYGRFRAGYSMGTEVPPDNYFYTANNFYHFPVIRNAIESGVLTFHLPNPPSLFLAGNILDWSINPVNAPDTVTTFACTMVIVRIA